MSKETKPSNFLHAKLFDAIKHFAHVLPAQASIRDFVHHNTLHGFEHLKFEEALKVSHDLTGAYGFWPQEKFRECYLKARITDSDIDAVLQSDSSLNPKLDPTKEIFCTKRAKSGGVCFSEREIKYGDIYRIAALFPLKKISSCQLKWQIEEAHALEQFQDDVIEKARGSLLSFTGQTEKEVIKNLWHACLKVLNIDDTLLHPEELVDLAPEQAEKIFSKLSNQDGFVTQSSDKLSDSEKQQLADQQQAWKELEALANSQKDKSIVFNLNNLIKTLTGYHVKSEVVAPTQSKITPVIRNKSWKLLNSLVDKVGTESSLRTFLKNLTGTDVQDEITPYLLPYIANWLDEGFAQWHADPQEYKGFYQSWKASAIVDESAIFTEIPDWKEHIDSLPDNAIDTVVSELRRMSIPENKWGDYLTRIALDLPGWSGMFYWRHQHPEYGTSDKVADESADKVTDKTRVDIMDYLAVRLVLEHLYIRKLCRKLWLIEGNLSTIRGYLHKQHDEFLVRYSLYNEHLPEYLKSSAQYLVSLTAQRDSLSVHGDEWQQLAQMIWTWQQSPSADSFLGFTSAKTSDTSEAKQNKPAKYREASVLHDGWILFRLAQHVGLSASEISQLTETQIDSLFECINVMKDETASFILLKAYERHYRESVFTAITKNHGRGTWPTREITPEAQLIFCMDDREEGIRRHLEHLNPSIETFGAAAFFGVVMNWKGLNEKDPVVLCPIVATPKHEIEEVAAKTHIETVEQHKKRFALRSKVRDFIHQDSHRSLLRTSILMVVYSPVTLITLMGKIFTPLNWNKKATSLKDSFDKSNKNKITRIETTFSEDSKEDRTSDKISTNHGALQHGFSIEEQSNIVESFLQNNGLLSGFSPFVVLIGHYSRNQNNPHAAAYGCGACGGKFSGPNGRVFASMANNSEVRTVLKTRALDIPNNCWFIGAEHDTCNENIKWEDTDLIPEHLLTKFETLRAEVLQACHLSAHERCRKLASAPKNPSTENASDHIAGRAVDFSQARPELGHATIAAGFVGRRHLSQGTFMDRRCFLISYDANVDPEGIYLERILLSAGPVGAGINLEYYFSSVNNERYGCGSKIVHNLSGLFGVMEGGNGDLRTGLPLQMIEIHEPMRLQLMVEAKTEVLTKIYKRQESIQQLVGNGWILLSAKDPESDEIHTFDPEKGWQLWKCPDTEVPTVNKSQDWYKNHYDHLSPALIDIVDKPTPHREVNNA